MKKIDRYQISRPYEFDNMIWEIEKEPVLDDRYIKYRPLSDIKWDNLFSEPKKTIAVNKMVDVLVVEMDNQTTVTVPRSDLIKYISEQQIIRKNEVVRKVYERYQVAVKLVRSDDNGDTGV